MTINPSKLRSAAEVPGAWLSIEAQHGPMLADAMEIADSCARADIESFCEPAEVPGGRWWNVEAVTPEERPMVDQALRYLDARGRIEYTMHQGKRLVRFKDDTGA